MKHKLEDMSKKFEEYDFYITEEGLIGNLQKHQLTNLKLVFKKNRWYVRHASGDFKNTLLWSGQDPINFLKSFWYAEKL